MQKVNLNLGTKINYVHNAITQHKIGEQASQESFAKVFKPVTSKLDDVIDSDLNLRMPQKRRRPLKEGDPGIDYMPEVDPYEDMDVEGLIDFGDYVPPQQEKQIVPKPPKYEESLEDMLKGKEIYVDPQYFPQDPQELPPKYDEDEEVDYALADEDETKEALDDLGIPNYESVDMTLNQPQMTTQKTKKYLGKILKDARTERHKLKGYKSHVTKKYKAGEISEANRHTLNKRLDNFRVVLNEYIKHHETKLKTIKGSGIKGRRRKQRGGNVVFFNDAKQLLKKLELIIGEVLAGNTSIQMRNMGVNILDTLLRMPTINRPQYTKLYNQYFKV